MEAFSVNMIWSKYSEAKVAFREWGVYTFMKTSVQ